MKTRRLGKTGLVVSEICLGTMTFGSFADEKESHAILDRADAAGVDFLDVAEIYPVPPDPKWSGRSEEIVGNWLEKRGSRDTLFIATKIAGPSGGWFRAAVRGGRTALDRHNVTTAVDGSLRRSSRASHCKSGDPRASCDIPARSRAEFGVLELTKVRRMPRLSASTGPRCADRWR